MTEGWALPREVVDIDDSSPVDLFLGRQHEVQYGIMESQSMAGFQSSLVSIKTYNMEALFRECVLT